jgi:hypothetical protein
MVMKVDPWCRYRPIEQQQMFGLRHDHSENDAKTLVGIGGAASKLTHSRLCHSFDIGCMEVLLPRHRILLFVSHIVHMLSQPAAVVLVVCYR